MVPAGKPRFTTEVVRLVTSSSEYEPRRGLYLYHTKRKSRKRYVCDVGPIPIFILRCDGAMSEVSSLRDVVAALQQQLMECLARTKESHEGGSREGRLAAEEQVRYRCHGRATGDVAYLVSRKIFRFKRRRGSEFIVTFEELPQMEVTPWACLGVPWR